MNKHYFRGFLNLGCIFILLISTITTSCKFFEEPDGSCELLDVYTKDEDDMHYIRGTLKISNTSNKNIYNSTISVQAKTNKRTYYKTLSLDITIEPDSCIYVPVELEFKQKSTESSKENWEANSLKIIGEKWK